MSENAQAAEDSRCVGNAFAQQKIRAWQPVIAPKLIIGLTTIFGLVLTGLGIALLLASNSISECSVTYGDPDASCLDTGCETSVTIQETDCRGPVEIDADGIRYIQPPVYMYYALTKFYQNHRRYLNSRNYAQLQGSEVTDAEKLTDDCDPALYSADGVRILSPCGLAARSLFNDSFSLEGLELDESSESLNVPDDITSTYKQPSNLNNSKIDYWLPSDIFPGGVTNPHFRVWMVDSPLSSFRKLYGVVRDQDVVLPLTVNIVNRYPVEEFGGTKHIVLTTMGVIGGRNPFIGIVFIVVGSLIFIEGLIMTVKNRRDPRILGDVRYLRWSPKVKAL